MNKTVLLADLTDHERYQALGKTVRLVRDIYNFEGTRRIKKAGEIGTLESTQGFYSIATVKIGKRNYNVGFTDLEILD
jgi:hypothetical protein